MTNHSNSLAVKIALLVLLFWSAFSQITLSVDAHKLLTSDESITLLTDQVEEIHAAPSILPGKGQTDPKRNVSRTNEFKHRSRVEANRISVITTCQFDKFLEYSYSCLLLNKLVWHFGAGEGIIPAA